MPFGSTGKFGCFLCCNATQIVRLPFCWNARELSKECHNGVCVPHCCWWTITPSDSGLLALCCWCACLLFCSGVINSSGGFHGDRQTEDQLNLVFVTSPRSTTESRICSGEMQNCDEMQKKRQNLLLGPRASSISTCLVDAKRRNKTKGTNALGLRKRWIMNVCDFQMTWSLD